MTAYRLPVIQAVHAQHAKPGFENRESKSTVYRAVRSHALPWTK